MIKVKILGLHFPERYTIRRLVAVAQQELLAIYPHLQMDITEVTDSREIGKYAFVLVLPTLVINEKVVCSGRFPARDEVINWLLSAVHAEQVQTTSLS